MINLTMMIIKIDRQYLEDLSNYFIPFMLKALQARQGVHEGAEKELDKICYSVLQDIHLVFQRKKLTLQKSFTIKFKEAEGIVFMRGLMSFPLPADYVWRHNLRNQIIEQLDKQIL